MLNFWKKYFNTEELTVIYEHLIVLKKEILLFEEDLIKFELRNNQSAKKILHLLNSIVDNNLNTVNKGNIYHESNFIDVLTSFEFIKVIFKNSESNYEEDIPKDELDELEKSISEMITKLEKSNIGDQEKIAFIDFFNDINKSLSIYKISGLSGFFEVIQKNICKVKLLEEVFEKDKDKREYIDFAKKVVGKIGGWTIKYMKRKVKKTIEAIDNVFDNEVVLYIENKLDGLAGKNKDDEEIEDGEILKKEEDE